MKVRLNCLGISQQILDLRIFLLFVLTPLLLNLPALHSRHCFSSIFGTSDVDDPNKKAVTFEGGPNRHSGEQAAVDHGSPRNTKKNRYYKTRLYRATNPSDTSRFNKKEMGRRWLVVNWLIGLGWENCWDMLVDYEAHVVCWWFFPKNGRTA